ncbi:MAG: hypothetical protein QXI60_04280 [Thermofilaceae archaeon]
MSERKLPFPLRPLVYKCDTFMPSDESYDSTTIIIVPIKFSDHGEYLTVKWSCSKGHNCRNKFCIYALKADVRERGR